MMRNLIRSPQQVVASDEEVIPLAPLELQGEAKWETDPTPEAFYARIGDVAAVFTQGKCTKALAVQRLLDLLYDINQSPNSAYGAQTKSRYYLLVFNYIYRIRSARRTLADIVRGRSVTTDQTMYISGVDFSNLSVPGLRVENALFKDCNFFRGTLQGLGIKACQFIQCNFDDANLTHAEHAEILGASFEGVTFIRANLSSSRIQRSSFVGCDFSEIVSSRGQRPLRVNGCDLVACSFREADLRRADFRKTRMTGCDTLDAKKQDARGLA
jgi:fluoroquinolone resistance protein